MSKTHVALFDENKHIVMMVYWEDAWIGVPSITPQGVIYGGINGCKKLATACNAS
ncbi:MAG: hypothetical protein ACTSYL_10850 [Candidatus Thorarchaeota archaeon]